MGERVHNALGGILRLVRKPASRYSPVIPETRVWCFGVQPWVYIFSQHSKSLRSQLVLQYLSSPASVLRILCGWVLCHCLSSSDFQQKWFLLMRPVFKTRMCVTTSMSWHTSHMFQRINFWPLLVKEWYNFRKCWVHLTNWRCFCWLTNSVSLLLIFCPFSSNFIIFGRQLLPTFRQCWLRLTNWRCLSWWTTRLTLSPGIASFIQNQCDETFWYTIQSNHIFFERTKVYC